MKDISLKDIANEMEMSRNTISKALKGSDIVASHTRQKIIKKAIEMGYKKIPKELKDEVEKEVVSDFKRIIIFSKREFAEFWNRIIIGISDIINESGYTFMMYFLNDEDEHNLILPKDMQPEKIEGIICLSVFEHSYYEKIFETKIPIVCFDSPLNVRPNDFLADRVLVDSYSSVYEITTQLIKDGKRKFSFIGDIHYCKTVLDRWSAFTDALRDHNIPYDQELSITEHVPMKYYNMDELVVYLERLKEISEVIICANDDIALFTIRFLESKNYKVPEDVIVSGFDDQIVLESNKHSLITVHVDNEYLGKRITEQLYYRIKNPESPYETIYVNTSVVYRGSTLQGISNA